MKCRTGIVLASLVMGAGAVHAFDLGGIHGGDAGNEVVRLSCIAPTPSGTKYAANVAIDRVHQTVIAYVPVLKLGLKFVDGQSGDPQYGDNHLPLGTVAQHVHVAGNTAAIVNEGPGGTAITLYDLVVNTVTTTTTAQDKATTVTYRCERVK